MLLRSRFHIRFPGKIFAGSPVIFLSLCCFIGILCGTFLAAHFSQSYGDLMRSAAISSMSVGGSVVTVFLPLLLCVVCIHCGRPKLLYGICFLPWELLKLSKSRKEKTNLKRLVSMPFKKVKLQPFFLAAVKAQDLVSTDLREATT